MGPVYTGYFTILRPKRKPNVNKKLKKYDREGEKRDFLCNCFKIRSIIFDKQ